MSIQGKKVIVHDGNIEKALRKFKKKISEDGVLQELQNKQFYTKPTVRKKIAKGLAKRRWQRYLEGQQLPKKQF